LYLETLFQSFNNNNTKRKKGTRTNTKEERKLEITLAI